MLTIKDLSKTHANKIEALQNVNLSLHANVRYGIVGETGSGKSTLLRSIAGLEQIDSGKILLGDEQIKGPLDQLIPGHNDIAYLSQDYRLPKFITVEEFLFDPYSSTDEIAQKVYNSCGIEHLIYVNTDQLSGGEKQRVALAKQLMKTPQMLLLDEPFSNLDHQHKQKIKSTLEDIEKVFKTTIVLVAHDPVDILSWAHEVIILKNGTIIQKETPKTIYHRPLNEYVAGLFGSYNLIDGKKWNISSEANYAKISKLLIVRPEDFIISRKTTNEATGIVDQVHFMGAYDELVVITNSEKLLVRCRVGKFRKNDTVEILLKYV